MPLLRARTWTAPTHVSREERRREEEQSERLRVLEHELHEREAVMVLKKRNLEHLRKIAPRLQALRTRSAMLDSQFAAIVAALRQPRPYYISPLHHARRQHELRHAGTAAYIAREQNRRDIAMLEERIRALGHLTPKTSPLF